MRMWLQKVCIFVFAAMLNGCESKAEMDWPGVYTYEHEVGAGAGGVVSYVEYTFTLSVNNECSLAIAGLQIDTLIACTAVNKKNSLVVHFKSYANGQTKNALGVEVYKVGASLFVLNNEKAALITHWDGLKPDGIKGGSGEYFAREN